MTPAARAQSAIVVLDIILSGTPSEQALTRWARSNRFAGSKDRAAIRDLVFDAIRCKRSYAAISGALTGRGLILGSLYASGDTPETIFDGSKYGPSPLTEEDQQSVSPTDLAGAERADLQDWVWEKLTEDLGDKTEGAALALRERADVFLRVNLLKSDVSQAAALLKDENIETEPHPLSPTALRVTANPRRVAQSSVYKQGVVELQDAASQAVCEFLALPETGKILDYCAGGGGKSLAIAARSKASIYAHDANPHRMSDLPERAKRAGAVVKTLDNAEKKAPYDVVFCDVPCSGSGSWRRSPDGKWALSEGMLADLLKTQSEILDTAADLVAEGGELAYATCSMFRDENDLQIASFLQRHPEWRLIADRRFLPQDGGDGFYIARLTRA